MTIPMELDGLRSAIDACEKALHWAGNTAFMESLPEEAQEVFRSGVIQNFEVAYDECRKYINRWLKESDIPVRRNLLQTAGYEGLIDDVERWMEFREARNKTSHFYNVSFAEEAFEIAADFLHHARRLLAVLEERSAA